MRLKACGNRGEMPTEWEQNVAEIYVNYRELVRPQTNFKTVLISVLFFVLVTSLITWFIHIVFSTVGIFAYMPSNMQVFYEEHFFLSIVILYVIVFFIGLFFYLKHAVVGVIKLYQHYAPDDIRRRCLFMPTCSEYAIIAIRKYGVIIGLFKSYFRLFFRCKGNIYMIDYP
jgi:putative component of membrane protein insertase Oxa1/YidC/SpoIIIJ protein YidD